MELAINRGISEPTEVNTLLQFYHDIGAIVHYTSSATSDPVLNNMVVLNPQWLVAMIHKVTVSFPHKDQVGDRWTNVWGSGKRAEKKQIKKIELSTYSRSLKPS